MICTPHQTISGWSNQGEWDGRDKWHVWVTGEVHIRFWCRNLTTRKTHMKLGG